MTLPADKAPPELLRGPIGIIGLGLMGGSLARDLAARGVVVAAYDADPAVLDAAAASGAVHEILDPSRPLQSLSLLVLATPVGAALDFLPRLAPLLASGTRVTDLGSTKGPICRLAAELGLAGRFVGSHPLAGDHRSGWDATRTDLYRGATTYLCAPAGSSAETVAAVRDLWEALGAIPIEIDAAEHDRRMAWVSHLPQVVSSALAATIAAQGFSAADLGPGGRDMTRLASSSPAMWGSIAETNAVYLLEAVRELQARLGHFEEMLQTPDAATLQEFFRSSGARPA